MKNIGFLQGKLKELMDVLLGPDVVRQWRATQLDALFEKLRELLTGEDEMTSKIRRGLALNDASRHRPDIDHPMPMEALEVFKSPHYEKLRKFSHDSKEEVMSAWRTASMEYLLASTLLCFIRFLDRNSQASRECMTVRHLSETLVTTMAPVLNGRSEGMAQEPELTYANMLRAAETAWSIQTAAESQYRQLVVKSWCEENEQAILDLMDENIEERGDGGQSLWGGMDDKYERLKLNTPLFNFLDFIVSFLDFCYANGYVFKPSSKPVKTWNNEDVCEWARNLKFSHYLPAIVSSGINGDALLELSRRDLEEVLEVRDGRDQEKLWANLEVLRKTSTYEPVGKLVRETRRLETLRVPDGARGGENMVVHDPSGKQVNIVIPTETQDRTRKLEAGMEFKHKFTYKKVVLNKWQLAQNSTMKEMEGFAGCLKEGEERNARTLWKGALRKVKTMNLLESKVSRRLRMSQSDDTVRLSAMDLLPRDAYTLRDFLVANSMCKRLELSFNRFGAEGATILAQALKENRSVSELRIASNCIGDKGAIEIAELIRVSEYLEELDLGDNDLSCRSGIAIFYAAAMSLPARNASGQKVPGSHILKRVLLYHNRLGPQTMQAWAKCISKHPKLEVDLTDNNVGDEGLVNLSRAVTRHWTQDRMDLRGMRVGPVGLMSLVSSIALHSFRSVSTLYLSGNPLGGEGADHLILLLERNLALTALDVSGCSLQDKGVEKIAQGLERNERLEYIDLGDNDISDHGVNAVAAMLAAKGKRARNRQHLFPFSLKRVVLSTNGITSTGFGQFAAAVTIAHLATIELSSCKITDNGCRAFSQHLANNRTLKIIDLSSNLLTADGVWVLAESIIANRSIETIRINDNRLLDSGGRGIATILNGNHHIQEVNVAGNGIGPKGLIPIFKVLMMRPVPLELHIHGNPYLRDDKCLKYIDKLESSNRIVSVNQ